MTKSKLKKFKNFVANQKQLQEDRCFWSNEKRNLSRFARRSFRPKCPRDPNHCTTSNLSTTSSRRTGKIYSIFNLYTPIDIFLTIFWCFQFPETTLPTTTTTKRKLMTSLSMIPITPFIRRIENILWDKWMLDVVQMLIENKLFGAHRRSQSAFRKLSIISCNLRVKITLLFLILDTRIGVKYLILQNCGHCLWRFPFCRLFARKYVELNCKSNWRLSCKDLASCRTISDALIYPIKITHQSCINYILIQRYF